MNVAHFWNLTPAQIAKIEATCLKIIAEPRGNNQTKRSCMRYLSRVGSKSTDLREHLMTFASNSSTYEGMDAVRALGILKHKPAIAQLKPEFMRANLVRTVSVRKGRKTTQVKQSTWVGNDNITNLAVALADMGDRDAMPAIKYYLSTNEQGLVEDRGFSALVFEATLASPAMQKRLIPLIKATLKKLVGVIGKNSSAAREYRYAHMALLQMGDKDGYSFIMKVLEGHDKDTISETLQQLGGMLTPLASGPRGIQRIKVGKGAISPSDANNMLQLIQKRMRFWPDKKVKEYATRVILELMGAIKAGTR